MDANEEDHDYGDEAFVPERFREAVAQVNELRDRACRHGGPPPQSADTLTKVIPNINECLMMLTRLDADILRQHANDDEAVLIQDLTNERVAAKLNALIGFWSPRSADIHEAYPKLAFSLATDATLDNNLEYARLFMQVGIFLRAWCALGGEVFTDPGLSSQLKKEVGEPMYKTRTTRGMVLYLNKQTPCDCLKGLAATEKAKPKSRKCNYCKTEGEAIKLMKCSACGVNEYCSKACQRADWKFHKDACKSSR